MFVPHWVSSVRCKDLGGCDEHYVYIDVPPCGETELTLLTRTWQDESRVYDGPLLLGSENGPVKVSAEDVVRDGKGYDSRGNKLISIDKTYLLDRAAAESQSVFVKLV